VELGEIMPGYWFARQGKLFHVLGPDGQGHEALFSTPVVPVREPDIAKDMGNWGEWDDWNEQVREHYRALLNLPVVAGYDFVKAAIKAGFRNSRPPDLATWFVHRLTRMLEEEKHDD
jgi:hypothetical protein